MQKEWLLISRGFSVVEVLLASAVFALLVTVLVGAYIYGEEASILSGNLSRGTSFAEEGLEVVRNIRDTAWSNLVDGTYGLGTSTGKWVFSGSSDTNGIFTRQVTIASVDTKRKSVTAVVTWQQNPQRTGSVLLVSRLARWNAAGWATPVFTGTADSTGTNDGLKIQTQGNYAYLVRSGGTPNFAVYDISTPASPTLVGSLTLSGAPSDIAVSGNYAYVSNTSDTQELQVVNVSTPGAPSMVGSYDAAGSANANGVFVVGTT
ncbi:MAG TPA: hypothetical protein VM103_01445, partial [Candidatus Paceibacterota bacterium]|nr:hypothetical protein [Candidatus Paceibacterota bacterium]